MSLRISHRQIGIIVVLQVRGRCRHGRVVTVLVHRHVELAAHCGLFVGKFGVFLQVVNGVVGRRERGEREGPQEARRKANSRPVCAETVTHHRQRSRRDTLSDLGISDAPFYHKWFASNDWDVAHA